VVHSLLVCYMPLPMPSVAAKRVSPVE